MNPAIQNVNLDITTHCNRRCPDCCCGIGINRELHHHDWSYFERAAAILYGIPRVNLTGGEPTIHPRFAEFVPRFKTLFGCQVLSMITDGAGVLRYWGTIAYHIDYVEFSDYGTHQEALDVLRHSGIRLSVFQSDPLASNFVPRSYRGGGRPCIRAVWRGGTIAYADSKIYGCCVAPGIDGAVPVEISPGWDEQIMSAPLPCGDCWFSE